MARRRVSGYRSNFESQFADYLKHNKVAFEYEQERLSYVKEHNYVPDFVIITKSGKKIYIETKGRLTSFDRTKLKAVKERHPEIDLRLVLMSNNKIRKNSKVRYADWCEKYGFPCCVGIEIPEEWLKEAKQK